MAALQAQMSKISNIWAKASQDFDTESIIDFNDQLFTIPLTNMVEIIEGTTEHLLPHLDNVAQALDQFRSEILNFENEF